MAIVPASTLSLISIKPIGTSMHKPDPSSLPLFPSSKQVNTYIYSPSSESKDAGRQDFYDVLYFIATVVVFAGIGVLLAWRG